MNGYAALAHLFPSVWLPMAEQEKRQEAKPSPYLYSMHLRLV